jgi:YegS/Rv2252/BmrU family lipid kinase
MAILDKKIKLIYNPNSGNQSFKNALHECIVQFQEAGYETHVFSSKEPGDIERLISDMPRDYYDALAVSGGDGTFSIVANALLQHGHDIALLLIPSGTSNDFAASLKISKNVKESASLIKCAPTPCDVGIVNGRYFLNVCAAGFMADISQIADKGLKDSLGNFAYYLTALGKLTNLTSQRVRITNSLNSFEEDIYLFLALNSSGVGGLYNLSPDASICDGLFDFIVVKAVPLIDFAMILVKLLSGDHLNDTNVIYFQDSYVKLEALNDNNGCLETDVDGETGPKLPIIIENRRHALRIFTAKE